MSNSNTEILLKRFHRLSDDEQLVLLAMSVLFVPVGQTRLKETLRDTRVVETKVYKQINQGLKEKLLRQKLISVSNDGWRCAQGGLSEVLIKMLIEKHFDLFVALSKQCLMQTAYVPYQLQLFYQLRDLRIFLYFGDAEKFAEQFWAIQKSYSSSQFIEVLDLLFFSPFDENWFAGINATIKSQVLMYYLKHKLFNLEDMGKPLQLLQDSIDEKSEDIDAKLQCIAEYKIIQGDVQGIDTLLKEDLSVRGLSLQGSLCFIQNSNDAALEFYYAAIDLIKKQTRKRNVFLPGIHGYFFNLALWKTQKAEHLGFLKKQLTITLKAQERDPFIYLSSRLQEMIDVYQTQQEFKSAYQLNRMLEGAYDMLFHCLLLYWLDQSESIAQDYLRRLESYCLQAEKGRFFYYAAVSAVLLEKLHTKNMQVKALAETYKDSPFVHIVDILPRVEPWQRALQALTHIQTAKGAQSADAHRASRLIWLLTLSEQAALLEPREQKLGKTGRWTKGRPIALKRLHDELGSFDFLSDQDRKICAQMETEYEDSYYRYSYKEHYFLGADAILAAVGHPNIYWANASQYNTPITLSKAEPQLLVTTEDDNLRISLHPVIRSESAIFERTADNEVRIYQANEQHRQVAAILGSEGLSVPHKAKQQVIDSIASIASTLTVQSDIEGLALNIETVDVDGRLHVHLQPVGDGLQVEVFVQPFADAGPIYKPGAGGVTVFAEIDGKQLQTVRDFSLEAAHLEQLQGECPGLYPSKEAKWLLDEPEMALEALLVLQTLGDFVVLEWPKGQKIKVSREAGLEQAHFSVRKEQDWFSVDGELQVDEEQVYDMQRLINLLNATSGRFLKLEEGQFIALTSELRQRLEDISGLGEQKGKKLQFHALAAPALDEALEGMDVKASKQWQAQLEKLASMADLEPVLPSTLQGELRDYQLEGYQWMARLAHWGAGACLADDMGLGKTIQALSLILSRAMNGPTLILAPTSVCMNWLEEAQRFAPTLKVWHFGSGDRKKIIEQADAFDLIVCSYGLLQTEAELLTGKHWHTIVADEAQAIKNALTKRSQAAMALQADFKMITTGTPIENHLGELWNLFHFINPGLLGSLKKFNERYAQAIENDKDHATQLRLKKLLRPFILRRLKTDVLKELPARTEITLHVELSQEERTFYEAMRRNAVEAMAKAQQEEQQAGQQHLKVLAEIMKLRRACCHPKLVMEDSPLSSAKLQAFEELVDELIDNRHKALVFSQFVGHLAIIKELLDKKGINYQYLDGSTSIANRKKAVNAFQAGDGDVFLISLKAGGSGLNLTAADYVIHMDPWWNPAVEDQASDRAHRMGQKRPVTIYRLVAKDTIEDKIVDLHAHKRDLASSLLEGGEVSGKLSVSDMMALIRETE